MDKCGSLIYTMLGAGEPERSCADAAEYSDASGHAKVTLRVEIEMDSGEARNYGSLGAKDVLAQ